MAPKRLVIITALLDIHAHSGVVRLALGLRSLSSKSIYSVDSSRIYEATYTDVLELVSNQNGSGSRWDVRHHQVESLESRFLSR